MGSTVAKREKVAGPPMLGMANFLPCGGFNVVERYLAPTFGHYPQNGVGVASLYFRDVELGRNRCLS